MNCLLDTHVFLWAIFSPKKISKKAINILLDLEQTKYVSIVTFWEISLKYQLKKLDLTGIYPDKLPSISKDTGFEILELDANTASSFYKLPKLKGKDPFDRMLAWQAVCKDLLLLTKDADFTGYKNQGLKTIW